MPGAPREYTKTELLAKLRSRLSPLKEAPRFLGSDHAAVLMLITLRGGNVEVLFGKRAENPHDPWSGQISFPGGRSKEIDASLIQTACREFFEETFFDICKKAEILGFLDPLIPLNASSLSVTPFVAYADRKFVFTPSSEITETFWAPLDQLERRSVSVRVAGTVINNVSAFVLGGHVIWGLTAQIVEHFMEVLTDLADAVWHEDGDRTFK